MANPPSTYPGGSKSRVTRAGAAVRGGTATADDMAVIDYWRAAHRPVLNAFNVLLRNRVKNLPDVKVGIRHKRKRTIFNKLQRFNDMQLARMDDIAGCRVIFQTMEDMYAFRAKLHAATFNHRLRNEVDKYDYIKAPKNTGYRGVHDIYEYDAKPNSRGVSTSGSKGLYLEIQYRTFVQHAWATAVEVIGNITRSQPKFQQGDERYERIMLLASEILSRHHEKISSYLVGMTNAEIIKEFIDLDEELGLMQMLRGINTIETDITAKRNVILIFGEELEVKSYRYATEAISALFKLEKENPDKDIVLVRADTAEEVRTTFRNYFSDARAFVELIEEGCKHLAEHTIEFSPEVIDGFFENAAADK